MPVRNYVRCLFRVVFCFFNFALITVYNIYHSQNVSSKRIETLTVTCSHSAETVEFTVSIAVSNSYG